MSPLSITSTLALPSGTPIPRLGFGVYLSPPSTCSASVAHALSTGYRHIDTAQYYENESAVGDAVRASALPRSSVFLTTKILFPGADVDATYASIAESVAKLDAGADGSRGYVDLFLIHSPNGGAEKRRIMWTALQRARDEGIVREIGVSNYAVDVLEEIRESGAAWPPAVNQIELHPWCQQRALVDYCAKHSIAVQAYCPLVRNEKANDPTLTAIAAKHAVGPNQVLVRWSLQKGWVPLPKSDTPSRIEQNADVFGFELDDKDMAALDALDQGEKGAIVQVGSGTRE